MRRRMEKPKTRLGRALLNRQAIVEAALALVDEDGVDELSTRKLAARLGCEPMTLYHHFPTKGALLDGIAERLTLRIRREPRGDDAIARFVDGSRALYGVASSHPRAFSLLATRRANTPAMLAFYDALVAPLLEAGLDPKDAALVFRTCGYFTLGAGLARAATEAHAREARKPPLESPSELPDLPNLARVAKHLTLARVDALFERGLRVVLTGLRAELAGEDAEPRRKKGSKIRARRARRS